MENYAYNSYPESGDSSPRSREIDFDPPWEDQQQSQAYKVKFMCSYGGKIHPRPHDNQLSYTGGETKILAVDRTIKFPALVAKLSVLCDGDVSFKYQLPGEDLDALISVTNDDDLEHMMHEYDRLYRASPKPARLRLFLFPVNPPSPAQSFGSSEDRSERKRFMEALNSGPAQSPPPPMVAVAPPGNADFLFGSDKGMQLPPQVPVIPDPEVPVHIPVVDDRVTGSDPIQKHIHDLQRLRIGEERAGYRRKSEENLAGNVTGDYYVQKMPEKVAPTTLPGSAPMPMQLPSSYWPESQMATGAFPTTTMGSDQQVYMIPAQASMYHAPPSGRPMTGLTSQGYYAVQRMPQEVHRDQQLYSVVPPAQSAAAQPTLPPQPQQKVAGYAEAFGMARPATTGGGGMAETGYVGYDAMGRQVYYTAAGVVQQPQQPPSQYHAMAANAAYGADMRSAGNFNQEGVKVIAAKVPQTSV
ncbi:hypothetical protein RJ639_006786 [Escallonia herrerae]|uniref:PB1 domain-containing protein n=1 Tax=Escallonia herrerae TaxID=1293975 RepID=A0AA89AXL9_9ASTE|nr:hypothetical protein RJ639_006786 [Escallonia herrerae]